MSDRGDFSVFVLMPNVPPGINFSSSQCSYLPSLSIVRSDLHGEKHRTFPVAGYELRGALKGQNGPMGGTPEGPLWRMGSIPAPTSLADQRKRRPFDPCGLTADCLLWAYVGARLVAPRSEPATSVPGAEFSHGL
jgi:hypothetical protein